MNPKIHKLRDELAKLDAKLSTLQERKQELEKQLLEAENTDIVGAGPSAGLFSGTVCRAAEAVESKSCSGAGKHPRRGGE